MSERFPLQFRAVPGAGRPAAGKSAITLAERRPGSVVEFAFWDIGRVPDAAIVPGARTGANLAVATPGYLHLSLAPGRYLAIAQEPGLATRLEEAVPIAEGTVTDLTHGRAGLRIAGGPAADLLQKGLSFDLGIAAFPPLSATTAGLDHMTATVIRLDAVTFDVLVMTNFADALWAWVTDAAVEFGWQVAAPVT